jgi:hypothetical protein
VYKSVLADKNTTLKQFKDLVYRRMPEITTVINVEYETKRKFYYDSDKYIQMFKALDRPGVPQPLMRIYKIIDNRSLFLDYLTSTVMSFKKNESEYASWRERLRNTKLEGIKADERLLRDYSYELDERIVKKRFISAVATSAVYNDSISTGFVEDISDILSNLNDNHKQRLSFSLVNDEGEVIERIDGGLLADYGTTKAAKEQRLKNRKKPKT